MQNSQNFNHSHTNHRQTRPTNGNVDIAYVPKNGKDNKVEKAFNGGEYVEYEEIKKK